MASTPGSDCPSPCADNTVHHDDRNTALVAAAAGAPAPYGPVPSVPWSCGRIGGLVATVVTVNVATVGIAAGGWGPLIARYGVAPAEHPAEMARQLAMIPSVAVVVLVHVAFAQTARPHPGPVLSPPGLDYAQGHPWCLKCDRPKPAEAHHCSTCGTCVDRMDHHCPWMGQCVGRANHKPFALFLLYITLGGVLLPATVVDYVVDRLRRGVGSLDGPDPYTAPVWLSVWLVIAFFLALLFALTLGCFFGSVLARALDGKTQLDHMRGARREGGFIPPPQAGPAQPGQLQDPPGPDGQTPPAAAPHAQPTPRPAPRPARGGEDRSCAESVANLRDGSVGVGLALCWACPTLARFPVADDVV